ncbi:MAG: hypothetical protein LHV68_05175 [Elusimicrobia bacterium]|nr:hypothetical protein [Candidatus Liberimonas magnetica]
MFKAFPHVVQKLFCASILGGMILNYLLSAVILAFTGIGFLAGISNLAGSIGFGAYLAMYKNKHGISGLKVKHRFGIPCGLYIEEANPFEHWLY